MRSPWWRRGGAGREHSGEQRAAGSERGNVHPLAARRSPLATSTEAAMPTLTMRELAEMTHGQVVQNPDLTVSSVVIDSREVKPDSAFFAIKGDRLDGHQFLPQALQTARAAVVVRVPESVPADKGIVRVADTTVALQQLAGSIRQRYKFLLIAITGSA